MAVTPFHSPLHPSRAGRAPARRGLRRGLALVAALVLLGAAALAATHAQGARGPTVASSSPVTMRRDQGLADCSGNPEAWSGFDYDGVAWQPMGSFPPSWGSRGPWPGILTITGRSPDPQRRVGQVVVTGLFEYRGTRIPVFGGDDARPTPLC